MISWPSWLLTREWQWFPGYIFEALSYFNWMTWISPSNVVLAVVTGSVCGLGINPLSSFDVSASRF